MKPSVNKASDGRTDQSRVARGIVNNDPLDSLKRRAEDLGLILHKRTVNTSRKKGGQK